MYYVELPILEGSPIITHGGRRGSFAHGSSPFLLSLCSSKQSMSAIPVASTLAPKLEISAYTQKLPESSSPKCILRDRGGVSISAFAYTVYIEGEKSSE